MSFANVASKAARVFKCESRRGSARAPWHVLSGAVPTRVLPERGRCLSDDEDLVDLNVIDLIARVVRPENVDVSSIAASPNGCSFARYVESILVCKRTSQ